MKHGIKSATEEELKYISIASIEKINQEKCKGNVIIHGIADSKFEKLEDRQKDDLEKVDLVFKAIGAHSENKAEKVTRIKCKNGHSLLRVELAWGSDGRIQILERAKKLRECDEFKNVYIRKDLTFAERILFKDLKNECKRRNAELVAKNELLYYYDIREMEIRKIYKRKN